jgi:hypothetical protein
MEERRWEENSALWRIEDGSKYAIRLTILVLLAAILISVYPAGAAGAHRPAACWLPVPTRVHVCAAHRDGEHAGLNMHAGPDWLRPAK